MSACKPCDYLIKTEIHTLHDKRKNHFTRTLQVYWLILRKLRVATWYLAKVLEAPRKHSHTRETVNLYAAGVL